MNLTLPISAARQVMLAAQGLLTPPETPAQKQDLLTAIRRIGVLQIDSIHVVARAPYFILFSRLGAYNPAWLEQLHAQGALFEYWAHAACFIPIEDYPLYRRRTLQRDGWDPSAWLQTHPDVTERVLERIRAEGALKTSDFEDTRTTRGTWWDWKAEKRALDYLWTRGDLMVVRRERFQRVYDLAQRVVPGWDDARTPSQEAVFTELTLRSVRALGVATARWVPDYFRLPKRGMAERLEQLAERGLLLYARIEGISEPAYLHPDSLASAEAALNGDLAATHTTLLSPFDPIVWDRARARQLFGFDYTIECYLPPHKRTYGYFSLPVLQRGALIGRADCKALRKEGIFEVRSLHLQPEIQITAQAVEDLRAAFKRCAAWHNTPQVRFVHTEPSQLLEPLMEGQ